MPLSRSKDCPDAQRTFGHPFKSNDYEWGIGFVPPDIPVLQQLRVDHSGRTEGGGECQNVESLTHLRNLCFGLVTVATRRSNQRIPVIRRVAAAQHPLEYGVGIGFTACGA